MLWECDLRQPLEHSLSVKNVMTPLLWWWFFVQKCEAECLQLEISPEGYACLKMGWIKWLRLDNNSYDIEYVGCARSLPLLTSIVGTVAKSHAELLAPARGSMGDVLWCKWMVPGVAVVLRTISQGAWVLPRLEDRGQPPFLDELDAGNLGVWWRLREGAHAPPPGPHGLMTRWLSLWARLSWMSVHPRHHWDNCHTNVNRALAALQTDVQTSRDPETCGSQLMRLGTPPLSDMPANDWEQVSERAAWSSRRCRLSVQLGTPRNTLTNSNNGDTQTGPGNTNEHNILLPSVA